MTERISSHGTLPWSFSVLTLAGDVDSQAHPTVYPDELSHLSRMHSHFDDSIWAWHRRFTK